METFKFKLRITFVNKSEPYVTVINANSDRDAISEAMDQVADLIESITIVECTENE